MVQGRVEGPVRGWKTFLILDLAIDFCAASEGIFLCLLCLKLVREYLLFSSPWKLSVKEDYFLCMYIGRVRLCCC